MTTTQSTSRLPALASLAAGMGIVGTSVTASKFLVGHIPIMLAMELRFLLAAVVLLGIARRVESGLPRLPFRLHLILAVQALSGVVAFNIFLLIGLEMTTATISGIITAATPAVIAIMSFLLGDRLSPVAWLGVLLTIGGVILVNLLATPAEDVARRPILGGMFIILAVIGEALYTILGRHATRSISPLATATWMCIYGTAMFLPFAIFDLRSFSPGSALASTWIAILYLSLFVTVVAFVLWFKGLATIPASTAGAFTGMIPITAVISAAVLLREQVGVAHLVGMGCVLAGILLVARAPTMPAATRPALPWRIRRSVPTRAG